MESNTIICIVVGLKPCKNLAQSMAVIIPSTFILKEGPVKVTLFQPIKVFNNFNHLFLTTAFAKDTTFFLENKEWIEKLVKIFTLFYSFLGLKPNISKCEISGLDQMKEVGMALCGMLLVVIATDANKILDIYFS